MCSLCFKRKNGAVDFIKADVLTCLCGSFKDKQQEAQSCLEVAPWVKADKALTKGSSTFVMTVLGHDTAFTARREDFIFSFRKFNLFQHYQLWKPVCHHPITVLLLTFVVLSLNSLIPKSSPAFMACFRTWLQPKKMCFTRVFYWLDRAEQPLFLIFFALARGDNSSSKPRSHQSPAPSFWEATGEAREEGEGYGTYRKIPFSFSAGIFQPCPVHFAEWEPAWPSGYKSQNSCVWSAEVLSHLLTHGRTSVFLNIHASA